MEKKETKNPPQIIRKNENHVKELTKRTTDDTIRLRKRNGGYAS